jgi:hypothetical protein
LLTLINDFIKLIKYRFFILMIKGKKHRTAEQLLGGILDTVASQGFDREGEPEVKDFTKNVGVALIFSGSIGK